MTQGLLTKEKVSGVVDGFLKLAKASNVESITKGIDNQLKAYQVGWFRLVVIADRQKGRAALINALLGKAVLPVETGAPTSTVYKMIYGDKQKYEVSFNPKVDAMDESEADSPPSLEITEAELAAYGTESGNPGNEKQVQFIGVQLPDPFLESGLIIITPSGHIGLSPQHDDSTWHLVQNADAVCFVLDSDEPIVSKSAIEGLREHLEISEKRNGTAPSLFFVQTETDPVKKEKRQEYRAENLNIISEYLLVPKTEINYFSVNFTSNARGISDSLKDEASGFPQLLDFFQHGLRVEKEEHLALELLQVVSSGTQMVLQPRIGSEKQVIDTFLAVSNDQKSELQKVTDQITTGVDKWDKVDRPQILEKDFKRDVADLHRKTRHRLANELNSSLQSPIVKPILDRLREERKAKDLTNAWDDAQTECVAKCKERIFDILTQYEKDMHALMRKTLEKLGESLEGEIQSVTVNSQIDKFPYNFNKDLTRRFSGLREVFFSGSMSYTLATTVLGTFVSTQGAATTLLAGPYAFVIAPVVIASIVFARRDLNLRAKESALSQMQNFLRDMVQNAQLKAVQEFDNLVAKLDKEQEKHFAAIVKDMKEEMSGIRDMFGISDRQKTNPRLGAGRQRTDVDKRSQEADKLLRDLKQMLGPHYKDASTHQNVATRLQDVALLIGAPQAQESMLISGEKLVPGLGLTTHATLLFDRATHVENGCLRLAVVGSVSRGKSTLVNAILGEPRLSVDMEACTGVITQIVHGSNVDEVTVVEGGESRIVGHEDFLNTVRLTPEEQVAIKQKQAFSVPERLTKIDYAVLECEHPLGEKGIHIVDTLGFRAGRKAEEITEAFLAKTDALVFVTRARPLFEEADKDFLETQLRLDPSRLEHIFFVINDFTGFDEQERAKVMANARLRLKDYFLTPYGEFDETLFNRRVFIVDARAALRARVNDEGGAALEATGLPILERGIRQMLEDEELLPMALEATTIQVLIPALTEASRSIEASKQLLSRNLSELERTQRDVEEQLAQLSERTRHIRDTFNDFAQEIGKRAADHFEDYGARMIDAWDADWETLDIAEVLRLKDVAVATLSSRKREALTAELGDRIGHYLERKMSDWETEVLQHLEPDMAEMSTKLEEEVQDFVVKLDEIQASIVGHQMSEFLDMDQRRGRKVAQMLYGVLALDPNQITGPLMGGSWKGFIGRMVSQVIAVIVASIAASFFTGPPGWMVFFGVLLVEVIFVHHKGRRAMLNNVRDKVGRELRTKLVASAPEMKVEIRNSIEGQFKNYADELLGTLRAEIEEVTAQLDNALANKREGETAVNAEILRLNMIEANLAGLFEQISREVYGRVLTPEEHRRLREGNALLSENA